MLDLKEFIKDTTVDVANATATIDGITYVGLEHVTSAAEGMDTVPVDVYVYGYKCTRIVMNKTDVIYGTLTTKVPYKEPDVDESSLDKFKKGYIYKIQMVDYIYAGNDHFVKLGMPTHEEEDSIACDPIEVPVDVNEYIVSLKDIVHDAILNFYSFNNEWDETKFAGEIREINPETLSTESFFPVVMENVYSDRFMNDIIPIASNALVGLKVNKVDHVWRNDYFTFDVYKRENPFSDKWIETGFTTRLQYTDVLNILGIHSIISDKHFSSLEVRDLECTMLAYINGELVVLAYYDSTTALMYDVAYSDDKFRMIELDELQKINWSKYSFERMCIRNNNTRIEFENNSRFDILTEE